MQLPLEYLYPDLQFSHNPVVFIQLPEHDDGQVEHDAAPPFEYFPSYLNFY